MGEEKQKKKNTAGTKKNSPLGKFNFFLLTAFSRVFCSHGTPPACLGILIAYSGVLPWILFKTANSIGLTD